MAGRGVAIGAPLMLLALVTAGHAQTPLLVPGVRVRVTGPCAVELPSGPAQCAVVVGRLRSWTPDRVIVRHGSGADRVIPRNATKLVEVSDGVRSHKTPGTMVGAGIGLAVGLATPCTADPSTDSQTLDYAGCTLARFLFVPLAIGIGAGAGRLVAGALLRSETWVSLAGEVATVGLAPRGVSGLAVAIDVRF